MRKTLICAASLTALMLTACSKPADDPTVAEAATETAAPPAATRQADTFKTLPSLEKLPVTLPQLAYAYDYRWELPADAIGALQRRHASLCEQQGPAICQITGMTKTGEAEGEVTGELQMAVATRQARAFGALLEDEAEDAGATQIAAEIASEELSKQMVDTEARLATRIALRDRLQEVLRTRKGKLEDLIAAERSVAAVNEEIDQARSWMKEMQGRVAYSRVTVRYETGGAAARDFMAPVRGALSSVGSILGFLAAVLILGLTVAVPVGGVWWSARVLRRRLADAAPDPQ
ncbi:DUF4349 domain-containing protein [Erythrobacter sp. NE805]|uniref:DUF4349 domain-containing protein n=1 Tax=Erythrobacter sp. NE805 TaxID=3389875 RepID=UPI00396B1E28